MYKLKEKLQVIQRSDAVIKTYINLTLERYPGIDFRDISLRLKKDFNYECTDEEIERLLSYELEVQDITLHKKIFNHYYNTEYYE